MTMVDVMPRAGRREWLGLVILCLPTLLTTVDISVVVLALPRMTADLGLSSTGQLWVTDIYGFMIAGFLVLMGTLGDRIGHRTVLLAGAAGFIVASLLAAFADSGATLLIARALLGIAAATVMPSVLALIGRMFANPAQMGAAFGIWGTSIMLGVVLGPVVGGLLLGSFWWGSIFLMGIPIMGLLLIAGPFILPGTSNPEPAPLDLPSVLLSLAALLPIIYGLKETARDGWQPLPTAAIIAGIAVAAIFISRQRTLANPMLDLRMFANPVVSTTVIFGLVFGFIMAGTGLVVTLHMQLVQGMSPLRVALWMLIPATAMIVGGNVGPAIARTVRPAYVLAIGLTLAAIGMIIVAQVSATGGLATLLIGLTIMYTGGSPGATLANTLLMTSAPPDKAGAAGSLSSTGGELGVALGIAILGTVASAVYRGHVVVPVAVIPDAAAPAHESIAGAITAIPSVPVPWNTELLDSAREAFTQSLHAVSLINAILLLGLAVLITTTLSHIPPSNQAMQQQQPPAPDGAANHAQTASR